jgi:hypothetical protein
MTATMGEIEGVVGAAPPVGRVIGAESWLRARWGTRLAAVSARIEHDAFLIVLFAIYLIGITRSMPSQVQSDTWMTLAYGREVALHGLPTHDTLTLWAHGRTWIDQQWLGQVIYYGLYVLGGLRAVLALNGLALALGTGLALVAARRRGGSARSVTWIALLTLVVIAWSSWTVRVQALSVPLFVLMLWLLAADSRRPSNRVFATLPLLVLWANIHGTAFLGAALIALRGATMALERERPLRERLPKAAVLLASPVLLLASPYGLSLVDYYHHLLVNPAFSQYVTEWAPTRFGIATAPFYLLALLAAWVAGKCASRLTRFEQAALFVTLVLAYMAVRSVMWFMVAALVLLPVALDGVLVSKWGSPRYRYLNALLGAGAVVACLVLVASALARPARTFTHDYPAAAGDRVAQFAAREPRARIFANERFADWLVLEHPSLAGRIAFDGRFELLTSKELASVVHFRQQIVGGIDAVRGYRLLVLWPSRLSEGPVTKTILASPGRRVVYRDKRIAVISQPVVRRDFAERSGAPSHSGVLSGTAKAYR